MKTTIEIPDLLFRKAKSRAAERGQTLKEFVTDALQARLAIERESSTSRRAAVDGRIRQVAAAAKRDCAHSRRDHEEFEESNPRIGCDTRSVASQRYSKRNNCLAEVWSMSSVTICASS